MTGFELALACLALNVYHEARNEPIDGRYAVALVTINRARSSNADICDIVFEPMQFSWTNDARDEGGVLLPEMRPKGKAWLDAMQVARVVISGGMHDFTGGSTHFHADYIPKPKWAERLKPTGKWGRHYFYR